MPNKCTFILLLLFYIHTSTHAQTPKSYSSGELETEFKKLANTATVLYIAAHPDDENTRLISWLVNEKCVRTGYLSLTRGDGGQNLIGSEQGTELGVIRSQELLAARKIDGAEQFFTRAFDFGYSKSATETFDKWNKEEILGDVVYIIRKFRPDIIITRFATDGSGGHGHHTASAILAEEAFDAAGDPTRYPKQLKTVNIWQPKRLLYNSAARFWNPNADMSGCIVEDVGGFNPALGKSYGEIAAESRSMHSSQGFGSSKQRGEMLEYFKPLKGDTTQLNSLFQGIDLTYSQSPLARKRKKLITEAANAYQSKNFTACTQKLLQALAIQSQLTDEDYGYKYQHIIKTILSVNGLFLEAISENSALFAVGDSIKIKVNSLNRSRTKVELYQITLQNIGSDQNCLTQAATQQITSELLINKPQTHSFATKICENTKPSSMFWLNQDIESNKFVMHQTEIGIPYALQSGYTVQFDLSIMNQKISYQVPVMYKFTNPEKGEFYRNLMITPPAMVNVVNNTLVCNDTATKNIKISIKAGKDKVSGIVRAIFPEAWKISSDNAIKTDAILCEVPFELDKKFTEKEVLFYVKAPVNSTTGKVRFELIIEGKTYHQGFKEISYDHIPTQVLFPTAEIKLVKLDANRKVKKIGYIPGAGDEIPSGLTQIGYEINTISDEQIRIGNLNEFETIITGVRAYNTNEKLSIFKQKLIEFVANGGNLIVQYNTNSFAGPFKGDIGPYPFKITRERITDENAKVIFENPKHPVLQIPNQLSEKDFEGWIQERSIYQAGEIDARYENIFSMADPNAKPSNGSLIIGKYGKGNFIYTGLVFFRELPAGVPGAYRLLVNLIELGK
jgi:LmbE family N-acetylglucosaminyl deacetylase